MIIELMKKRISCYRVVWIVLGRVFFGFLVLLVVILINLVLEKVKLIVSMVVKILLILVGKRLFLVRFVSFGVWV